MSRLRTAALAAFALAVPGASIAAELSPALSLVLLTDERRRGLSWSDERPTAEARGSLAGPAGFELSAGMTGLRRSPRHDGASVGIDTALVNRQRIGAVELHARLVHHGFPGRGRTDYVELGGGISALIGPVDFGLQSLYAPRQRSVGGDNLYVAASAAVALVGTPLTMRVHVGRTIGDSRDSARSARLRPRGDYSDIGFGLDHVRGPISIGLSFTDTFLHGRRAGSREDGARIAARVALDL